MTQIRVLIAMGTRPEAIKLCPVVQLLAKEREHFDVHVCATAQHRELLDGVLKLFGIVPDSDLNLMQPGQTLNGLASRILSDFDPILERFDPHWVLVQGDTTTAMACALSAFHRGIRVGHVEAGLRTGDIGSPFPEELNRRIASLCTKLHFAPTRRAAENLLREGISERDVLVTGNTVVDALLSIKAASAGIPSELSGLDGRKLVLVTAHRRENFGEPMKRIVRALSRLADAYPDHMFLVPVHPNPRVKKDVESGLCGHRNIKTVGPMDYCDLIEAMKRSTLVLTDSGGIQEEAPGLGVPVLVLRESTERPEGLEAGCARLVGTDEDEIFAQTSRLLDDPAARQAMIGATNPYGDGHASERIRDAIHERTERR